MAAFEVSHPADYVTVLGPCPGCWSWQVEWSTDVPVQHLPQEWNDIVEYVLAEHLETCSGLQEIVESLG